MAKKKDELRSARWFAPDDLRSMGHRSRAMQMGLEREDWDGKPIIAIINTWSDLSPCHHHLRDRAEFVKKGVYQAGACLWKCQFIPSLSNFLSLHQCYIETWAL